MRVIKVTDTSIAEFLLPYLVLHVVVGQEDSSTMRNKVTGELLGILQLQARDNASSAEREEYKRYYEV